ncbi:hypothetical protein CCACVL1_10461 [Corchorus capsularis]|uniref:Uncharacterized protein n=1 Tax=Corchorus capsularis TaxID=210143 RepID=A0A1R3IR12_COCAP|nr:hypothetical protein CCACVL1_10461 [Corchorus capsularis]
MADGAQAGDKEKTEVVMSSDFGPWMVAQNLWPRRVLKSRGIRNANKTKTLGFRRKRKKLRTLPLLSVPMCKTALSVAPIDIVIVAGFGAIVKIPEIPATIFFPVMEVWTILQNMGEIEWARRGYIVKYHQRREHIPFRPLIGRFSWITVDSTVNSSDPILRSKEEQTLTRDEMKNYQTRKERDRRRKELPERKIIKIKKRTIVGEQKMIQTRFAKSKKEGKEREKTKGKEIEIAS